jgi:DNA-binding GntR family transcriptional regulator
MAGQEDTIYAVLSRTLLAGRLLPGTQLVEARLAALFGVSRERIRKILHRLGHERLLDLIPNRGAFVASPSLQQAREIYEARRIIEGGIVGRLAGRLALAQLQTLVEHGRRERAALRKGDRSTAIRLSGEFHLLLAQCAGSDAVTRQLQELVSRTAMLVALFEDSMAGTCTCDEHEEIVEALRAGDAQRALRAMHAHLSLIETRLAPRALPECPIAPEKEIARAWRDATRKRRSGS